MDPLTLGIERLLQAAHVALAVRNGTDAEWFVRELEKLYAAHRNRVGNVAVRKTDDESIVVVGAQGAPRKLAREGTYWALDQANPMNDAPVWAPHRVALELSHV